jgi:hypothetical protein
MIEFTWDTLPGTSWLRGAPPMCGMDDSEHRAPPNPSMMKVKFVPRGTE